MIKAAEKKGGGYCCSGLAPERAQIAVELKAPFALKGKRLCEATEETMDQLRGCSNKQATNSLSHAAVAKLC